MGMMCMLKIRTQCIQCNKDFTTQASERNVFGKPRLILHNHFCSPDCKRKYNRKTITNNKIKNAYNKRHQRD
jgi:hypothetical protein